MLGSLIYNVSWVGTWLFFILFTRYRVYGRKNIPRHGPLLVVANHLNFTDPPLLSASLSRRIMFMAKKELFRLRFVALYLGIAAFPVSRGKLGTQVLRQSQAVLEEGKVLAIFPEGMRSRGSLRPALFGAAMLVARTGVTVLPVGISGTEKLAKRGWVWKRPRVTVNIGKPFSLPPVNGKLDKQTLADMTESMMLSIAELLPPSYRGHYGKEGNNEPSG